MLIYAYRVSGWKFCDTKEVLDKMKKRLLTIAVTIAMLFALSNSLPASAHEFTPQRYLGELSPYTGWGAPLPDVYLNCNFSGTSNAKYKQLATESVSNWRSACSRIKVSASGANVFFSDSWASNYDPAWYATCKTSYYPSSTLYAFGTGWATPPTAKTVTKTVRADIYVNIARQSSEAFTDNDIRKTYAHEIGHALGFDEVIDGTQSVMKQKKGSTLGWANYWLPQSHDIVDFNAKYAYVSW